MRVDKFLKVSRIIKRRTVANSACDGGRVSINGKSVKPSHEIKVGDVIEVSFGTGKVKAEVLSVAPTAPKAEASGMYRIIEE